MTKCSCSLSFLRASCCAPPTRQNMRSPDNLMSVLPLQGPLHTPVLGHSQHRHIPVVQLHWITQHFVSTVYLMRGVFFCKFVSAAMDFMVAVGKRLKLCHMQKKKKREKTSLEPLVFGTNSSCLLNSASGQAGTQLQQEVSTKCQTRLGSGSRVE